MSKKLYKNQKDAILFGVCSGIAEYLEVDTSIVRMIFLILIFFFGLSFWAYIIAGIILPTKKDNCMCKCGCGCRYCDDII